MDQAPNNPSTRRCNSCYIAFHRNKVGSLALIDEVSLVFGGGSPLGRGAGGQQRFHVVKPEFRQPIVVMFSAVARHADAVALHELPQSRYPRSYGAVDLLPIMEELFVRHARFLGDTVNELNHLSAYL